MKIIVLLALAFFVAIRSYSQAITFKKPSLEVNEPVGDNKEKEETFDVVMVASEAIKNVTVEISKNSTHPADKFSFTKITQDFKKGDNKVPIKITTAVFSDKTTTIIFKASYTDTKNELQLVEDTLRIKNVYPATAKATEDYTDWNDGKRPMFL